MNCRYTETSRPYICALLVLLFTSFAINSQTDDTLPVYDDVSHGKAPVFFLDFYQRHLSHLRGSHCPMYPSCSEYARKVIGFYSPLQAYPLICDRLLRCGHDFSTYADTVIIRHQRWIDYPYPITDSMPDLNSDESGQIENRGANDVGGADFLYRNGFYEQAYLEYLRCLSREKDSITVLKAAISAYYAYDYQRFTNEIVALMRLLPEKQKHLSGELYMLVAKRSYAAGLYKTAYTILEKYRPLFTTPMLHEEYRLLSTVTALFCGVDSVPKLTRGDYSNGSSLVNYTGRIDSLCGSLDRLRPRSTAAAGLLSVIIPGTGYMIGERKRTALFSLLLNGFFIWSTVEFVQQKNYGAASLSTLLGSGFYIGSIMGSMRAVEFYNQQKRHSIIRKSLHDLEVDP